MSLFQEVISSFDDVSNKEAISVLVRNVLAVTKDNEYDSKIIKSKFPGVVHMHSCMHYFCSPIEVARTYFNTKNNADQRKRNGKATTTTIAARRRQRKHNV